MGFDGGKAYAQSSGNHKRQVALALCLVPDMSSDLPVRNGLHSHHFDAQLRQAISPLRLLARIASPLGTGCNYRETIATVWTASRGSGQLRTLPASRPRI